MHILFYPLKISQMKKFLLIIVAVLFFSAPQFASVSPGKMNSENPKASELFFPVGSTGNKISLKDLSEISRKDFEELSGHKMKGGQKIAFKAAQKKLRGMIDEDGRVHNQTLKKAAAGESFHIGGFALGFVLGLIGVLIAYLINDDKKSKRVRWAWIGLGVWVVIVLIAILL